MKFKEIKQGMVIHCPTEEDAGALLEHLEGLGYYWTNGACATDHSYDAGYYKISSHGNRFWLDCGIIKDEITEFSDLVESDTPTISENAQTDSPMTTVEALEWIKKHNRDDQIMRDVFGKNQFGYTHTIYTIFDEYEPQEIIQKITAYEAKKKAEIEEGYFCELYEKRDGIDVALLGYSMWNTDKDTAIKDAQEKARKYVIDTRKLCYTRVTYKCRVKEREA